MAALSQQSIETDKKPMKMAAISCRVRPERCLWERLDSFVRDEIGLSHKKRVTAEMLLISDPVTDIADLYVVPSQPAGDDRLLELAGRAATQLGYAAA